MAFRDTRGAVTRHRSLEGSLRLEAMGLSGSAANFIALAGKKQVQQKRAPAEDQPADQPKRVGQRRNTAKQPGQVLPLQETGSDREDGSRDPSYQTETETETSETSDTDNEGEEELDKDPGSPRSEGQKGQDQPACPPTPGRY